MCKEKTVKSVMPVVMLSLALSFRQMSMTLVMPFISTYCKQLAGYTPLLAGVAVGIFGLMQAVFQISFGVLSDRIGNKKMMIIGLTLVVIGLLLAFISDSVWLLILARALQGCGAIIGVGYSWAAGIAGEKERVKAMSILGAFISAAAALAFAVGPLLRKFMPVNMMFLSCAALIFLNELYILFFIKDEKSNAPKEKVPKGRIAALLKDKNFIVMNISAFINNFMMVSVFYAVPIYLSKVTGETGMWKVFVPSIIVAVLVMRIEVRVAQKGHNKLVLMVAFLISALSMLFYFKKSAFLFLLCGTALFMCGYITLATIVATNVNRTVNDTYRGTANGIFNSFQYIGNFAGAIVVGALMGCSEHMMWLVTIGIALVGFFLILFSEKKNVVTEKVK